MNLVVGKQINLASALEWRAGFSPTHHGLFAGQRPQVGGCNIFPHTLQSRKGTRLLGRACQLSLIFILYIFYFLFISSLTAVPSENQCLSSGAYEWPVLISLKHAVGLSQHCFLLQEWLSIS